MTFFALLASNILLSRLLWVLVFDLFYCPELLWIAQGNKLQIRSEIGLDRNKFVQLTLLHHQIILWSVKVHANKSFLIDIKVPSRYVEVGELRSLDLNYIGDFFSIFSWTIISLIFLALSSTVKYEFTLKQLIRDLFRITKLWQPGDK